MTPTRRDFLQSSALTATLLALAEHGPHALADAARDHAAGSESPFLKGNFGPVHEEVTVENLPVIGKLPPELDGLFVRNGPNPQFPPPGRYHWFDGDGMLHGVRVRDGKASYRNRYVRTDGWKEEHAAGTALYGGLLDPPLAPFRRGKVPVKNTANTALVWHHGRLLALWEGGPPHAIRVPSLETAGLVTFGGKLQHPFTAHPKVDPATGEMLFFGYNILRKPYVQYSVLSPQGEVVRTTPIALPRAVMMHDFAVSARHTIFMDLPATFNLARALKGESPLKFEPELGARFGVLPRHGTGDQVKWFEAAPCYVFHTLNAYEDGEEVVLLACRMADFPAGLDGRPAHPTGDQNPVGGRPVLYRWRFNLKTGTTREEAVDDVASEFPRLNEGRLGRRSRFGYTAQAGGELFTGLLKYDFEKGGQEVHAYGKGRFGGEGVFVPRPGGTAEDDGWLVNYVFDAASGKSEMVVVDARELRRGPVARVLLPRRVPYGFHGVWIPGRALSAG